MFVVKLYSRKIFSYVFFVRKYFHNEIKANYGSWLYTQSTHFCRICLVSTTSTGTDKILQVKICLTWNSNPWKIFCNKIVIPQKLLPHVKTKKKQTKKNTLYCISSCNTGPIILPSGVWALYGTTCRSPHSFRKWMLTIGFLCSLM